MDNQEVPPQQPSSQTPTENVPSPTDKEKLSTSSLIKIIGFYSLIVGIIGTILVFGFVLTKQSTKPSPAPTPAITATPTINSTPTDKGDALGKFCGGSKDIQCPNGYICKTEGDTYTGEGEGICVIPRPGKKEGEMCGGVAGFQCEKGYRCKFACPTGSSTCDDSQYPYPDASGTCVKAAEPTEKTIYCPQDIKMCPDGKTSIRRTPPTCAFEPCP